MATRFATAGICLLAVIASGEVARAQDVAPQGEASVAAPRPAACVGVLCTLTPGSMERPIGADDARRMEAERAIQPTEAGAAPSEVRRSRHRHVAEGPRHGRTHGRSVAVRRETTRQRRAETKALASGRAETEAGDGKAVVVSADKAAAINAIFVLAPRPFDPYGGNYAPWLDRLSWRASTDLADDRTIFTPNGYAEAERAPIPDLAATRAVDDLSRRTDALSQRGFQTLKSDLGS